MTISVVVVAVVATVVSILVMTISVVVVAVVATVVSILVVTISVVAVAVCGRTIVLLSVSVVTSIFSTFVFEVIVVLVPKEIVTTLTAFQPVSTNTSSQGVVSMASAKSVSAAITKQGVIPTSANQDIIASTAVGFAIDPGTIDKPVISIVAQEQDASDFGDIESRIDVIVGMRIVITFQFDQDISVFHFCGHIVGSCRSSDLQCAIVKQFDRTRVGVADSIIFKGKVSS